MKATFFFFSYTITLSAPFVISAIFIFQASGFGRFTDIVEDLVPLPTIQQILGIDSEFLDAITGIIGTIYNLIQDGVERIVDLILSIPSGDEFNGSVRSQFAGCCITLFFLVRCGHYHLHLSTCLYSIRLFQFHSGHFIANPSVWRFKDMLLIET